MHRDEKKKKTNGRQILLQLVCRERKQRKRSERSTYIKIKKKKKKWDNNQRRSKQTRGKPNKDRTKRHGFRSNTFEDNFCTLSGEFFFLSSFLLTNERTSQRRKIGERVGESKACGIVWSRWQNTFTFPYELYAGAKRLPVCPLSLLLHGNVYFECWFIRACWEEPLCSAKFDDAVSEISFEFVDANFLTQPCD